VGLAGARQLFLGKQSTVSLAGGRGGIQESPLQSQNTRCRWCCYGSRKLSEPRRCRIAQPSEDGVWNLPRHLPGFRAARSKKQGSRSSCSALGLCRHGNASYPQRKAEISSISNCPWILRRRRRTLSGRRFSGTGSHTNLRPIIGPDSGLFPSVDNFKQLDTRRRGDGCGHNKAAGSSACGFLMDRIVTRRRCVCGSCRPWASRWPVGSSGGRRPRLRSRSVGPTCSGSGRGRCRRIHSLRSWRVP
jgi:hypothetical protein